MYYVSMNDLSINEFSKCTGISRKTVLKWLERKEIEGRKTGEGTAPWFIPRKEAERIRKERLGELQKSIDEILSNPIPSSGNLDE